MQQAGRRDAVYRELAKLESRPDVQAIPTGFAALDSATGGGLPRGRIVEIFGGASTGKTTLALRIASQVQHDGGVAALIDAEGTFDPAYTAQIGVAIDRLLVAQPKSAEQALEIACRLAASGAVDLVIVDSAAALVPDLELHSTIGLQAAGLHSRVMASGLRRLSVVLRESHATALFLNQTRILPLPDGPAERSAGGAPLKLYAAVRIGLTLASGGRLRFRIVKNKVTPASAEGDLPGLQSLRVAENR